MTIVPGVGPADETEPQEEPTRRFRNREEAGHALAGGLSAYAGRPDALVRGLPRGGVIVATAAARALGLPVGVWSARKLGVPGDEELAMGTVASAGITPEPFEAVAQGYEDFTQATDDDVQGALSKAAEPRGATGSGEAAVGS